MHVQVGIIRTLCASFSSPRRRFKFFSVLLHIHKCEQMSRWADEQMSRWADEQMSRWADEQMSRWECAVIHFLVVGVLLWAFGNARMSKITVSVRNILKLKRTFLTYTASDEAFLQSFWSRRVKSHEPLFGVNNGMESTKRCRTVTWAEAGADEA